MISIDDEENYVMRSHLHDGGYVTLAWPKELELKWLDYALEAVTLQLNVFRDQALRETKAEAAAKAEYDSWFPVSSQDMGSKQS